MRKVLREQEYREKVTDEELKRLQSDNERYGIRIIDNVTGQEEYFEGHGFLLITRCSIEAEPNEDACKLNMQTRGCCLRNLEEMSRQASLKFLQARMDIEAEKAFGDNPEKLATAKRLNATIMDLPPELMAIALSTLAEVSKQ